MLDTPFSEPFRWKNYVLFNNETIDELWNPGYCRPGRRVLYIMGAGFDVRMNTGLAALRQRCPDVYVTCRVVKSEASGSSSSDTFTMATAQNLSELAGLVPSVNIQERTIPLFAAEASYTGRKYIGDMSGTTRIITGWPDLQDYQDIYLDISSLSRGVYISLAGRILFLLDTAIGPGPRPNFFILATENADIDALIQEEGLVGSPQFLQGFSLKFGAFETIKPLLWLPILGEHKQAHVEATFDELVSKKQKIEIFPVLPFPSRDPRRSDVLFAQHHQLLFDVLALDFKDVLYVHEQNPYEVYLALARAIARFNQSMQLLGGCRVAISPFSSKLLSIGAILVSYELHKFRPTVPALKESAIDVGIITTVAETYAAPARGELLNQHQHSEVFVTWVAGEPYAPLS